MARKSEDQIWAEWNDLVNLSASELEDWLRTDASKSVGDKSKGESIGHASGRKIVKIQHTKKADLSDGQWAHMGKVVGYIKRHCAQGGPASNVAESAWRYSLMNWGHDPLADGGCAQP